MGHVLGGLGLAFACGALGVVCFVSSRRPVAVARLVANTRTITGKKRFPDDDTVAQRSVKTLLVISAIVFWALATLGLVGAFFGSG